MSNDLIQADYEQLGLISKAFEQQADHAQKMKAFLTHHIETLRKGAWIGVGANAFYAEMDNDLMPALGRLVEALACASDVVRGIGGALQESEEEAKTVLENDMQGEGGTAPVVPVAPVAPAPTPDPVAKPAPKPSGSYTVVSGDNLTRIAERHGVSLQDLIAANPQIKNPNLIYPGQVINIPGAASPAPAPAPVVPPSGNARMNPSQLSKLINDLNVESNPRYVKFRDGNPNTYDTYCNLYAHDVAKAYGAQLPLFVTDGRGNVTKWLGAYAMQSWLDGTLDYPGQYTQGPANGWSSVDHHTATSYAKQGYLVVVAGHGHMAVVRPETSTGVAAGDVLISQAGERNFSSGALKNGWGQWTGEARFYLFKG